MQEFIILFGKYQFIILATVLAVLQIFFVIKRSRVKEQIQKQVLLVKQLLKTYDSNHPIFQNITYFHNELEKHTEVSNWIKQSWESFYQRFNKKQIIGNSMIPLIEDHFDEYQFTQELGNRKVFEWLPGIFLTIGILPTFLGLYLSIFYLNTKNISFIDQATHLMNGVGIAFLVSIIATGLSLFWHISDRRTYFPFLLKQYDELRDVLQQAFPGDEPSSSLHTLIETQKSQMEDLKTFLSDVFIQRLAEQITSTLTPHLEGAQSMMKETLSRTTENHVAGMEKMIKQLVESLSELAGEQMQELGQVLRQTAQWQEKIHGENVQLAQSLQDSAIKQKELVEKTIVLSTQVQQHTSHFSEYQTAFQSMISEMNDTTNKNKELQIIFTDLLEKITAERLAYQAYTETATAQLQKNTEKIEQYTNFQNKLQQEYLDITTQWNQVGNVMHKLNIANSELLDKFNSQTEQFTRTSSQLEEVLSTVNVISRTNIKFFEDIQQMRHHLQAERQQIQQHLSEQLQQMDHRSTQMKEHWLSTHHMIKELNEQLNESSKCFVQHMHSGLEQTFTQFDTALTSAVNSLASGVGTLESLFQELPTQVEQLNHHVGEINSTLSKSITEANQSITQAIREVQHQTEVLSRSSWS